MRTGRQRRKTAPAKHLHIDWSYAGASVVDGQTRAEELRALGFFPVRKWNHGSADLGVVAAKLRWENADGEREFTSWRERFDVPVPLLYSGELGDADRCWLTESHSDCEALRAAGLVATTHWASAGSWTKDDAEQLRGKKKVTIVRHNDEAGREFVRKVVDSLRGLVWEVRVVDPPGGCNDAREALETGYRLRDFRTVHDV
jgi:hypothetical protein